MYRLIGELNAKGELEQKVRGVLTDYDLSSWKKDLEGDYTKTSQQRTGTPPYMAFELLQGTSTTHLYRHDLESLFYIMLLMASHNTITPAEGGLNAEPKGRIVMRKGIPPYQKWFNIQDYDTLGSVKESFFSNKQGQPIELSPTFEGFRSWLVDMRSDFSEGFKSKRPVSTEKGSNWRQRQPGRLVSNNVPTPAPFDDGTLGGNVDYSTVIEPTRYLEGELNGLIIRYDVEASAVQTGPRVNPQ